MTCKLSLLSDKINLTNFALSCCPLPMTQQLYGLCVFVGKTEEVMN